MREQGLLLRKSRNLIFVILLFLLSLFIAVPMFLILFYMFSKGLPALNFFLFTEVTKSVGVIQSGVLNAIIGSFMLVLIASIIAIPIGVLLGVFMSEFSRSRLAFSLRFSMDVLQGVPSIIVGVVAYSWLVLPMKSFSALSGGVALSIMMLPYIARCTEETLNLVPKTYKEAALALGVPYRVILIKVLLRIGSPGVLSGVILSIARISGETAPLLFTAFGNQFLTFNLLEPVHALPLVIFNYAMSPYEDWQSIAWGAALLLILFIFLLSIIVKLINKRNC